MKTICVYCGSSGGNDDYLNLASQVGKWLAEQSIQLVWGGAKVGLMGAVSNACLNHNGKTIGVIPKFMRHVELANEHSTQMIWVESMHERKQIMEELSDAFLILPGSIGTMDEFFEILTWKQLKLHNKPIIILNYNNYYHHLLALIEQFNAQNFIHSKVFDFYKVISNVEEIELLEF